MVKINFRKYNFNITSKDEAPYIFDEVRKKNVKLTPEEWVRQNLIHYLIYDLNFPKAKIAVEKAFTLNNKTKRFDVLVFDSDMKPFILIECKAQQEILNNTVLTQCLQYNMKYNVPYLCISNGSYTYVWQLNKTALALNSFPLYV